MMSISQLETCLHDLANAAKTLRDGDTSESTPGEVDGARRNVFTTASKLQTLVAQPADFIQHLAIQVRLNVLLTLRRNASIIDHSSRINFSRA